MLFRVGKHSPNNQRVHGDSIKIRSNMFAIAAIATVATLTACTTAPVATTPPSVSTEVKSLLWVGNSFFYYNNAMHGHVTQLMTASGTHETRQAMADLTLANLRGVFADGRLITPVG